MSHKQAIILRKDLNMRKGKIAAQASHASMAAILNLMESSNDKMVLKLDDRTKPWLLGNFKKIGLYVNSEEELLSLYNEAKSKGMICSLIQDSGLTEFGGIPTYTAVAIGPDFDDKINNICGKLPLF